MLPFHFVNIFLPILAYYDTQFAQSPNDGTAVRYQGDTSGVDHTQVASFNQPATLKAPNVRMRTKAISMKPE